MLLALACSLGLSTPIRFLRAEPSTNAPSVTPGTVLDMYHRGVQLYASGKLTESYACFQEVVTSAPTNPVDDSAYQAEWLMGHIQVRLGQMDTAVPHIARFLEMTKAKVAKTADEALLRRALNMVGSFDEILDQHGRMGLLSSLHMLREEILIRFLAKREGRVDFEKDGWWWSESWGLKCDQALMFRRLAQLDESDALMKQVVEETSRMGHPESAAMALEWLSEVAMLREHMDEAVQYREQERTENLRRTGRVSDAPLPTYRYVNTLIRRDGVTQRDWDLINESLDGVRRYQDFEWTFQASLVKCEMLAIEGKSGASLELLSELIERGRQNDSQRMLPLALKQRAQLKLDMGDVPGADSDAKESLALYRAMGWKRLEPDLYEIHAQCLGRQGRYAEALQVWQDAYHMSENLKLHHRSLHMLLGIAALELSTGNKAALKQIWARIDSFVRAHPDLPAPTLLRLRLARLDYLKTDQDRNGLLAAYQETQSFAQHSGLTAYQLRSWAAYQLEAAIPVASFATQPTLSVDLQPLLTTTRVATGELAHARFALVNPSSAVATGTVRLVSAGLGGDWTTTDQGWKIALRPQTNAAGTTRSLSIAPGTATALFLEAAPEKIELTGTVTVAWIGGTNLEARWEFGASTAAGEVAVVNASLAENNPFYAVTFYHELYYRGQTSTLQDFRVTASQPCRIEIVDAATGRLLAIDANGDGDFNGSGDVLSADADGDGYPDFKLGPERDVASFELLVYPSAGSHPASRELEITLWHREASGWIADAVDVLRMR